MLAQMGEGGTPPSFFLVSSGVQIPAVTFPLPSLLPIQDSDRIVDASGGPYRIAEMLNAHIDINTSGLWITLPNGDSIWRLKVFLSGALGVQLAFGKFKLPSRGKLFIYSADSSMVIGAFDVKNNDPSGLFATQVIPGECSVLEYFKPKGSGLPELTVNKIGYFYLITMKIHIPFYFILS